MRLTEGFQVIKICIVLLIHSIDTMIQVHTAPCKTYRQYRQEQQYRNELCVVTTPTLPRHQKKSLHSSLSFFHFLFINSPIHYLAKPPYFSAKPYTIWRNYRLLPNCIHQSPIAMLSAVSKNHKKRGPPPTVMNPTIPEIP